MNKICTSIKQSKKLIELGIDVSTADMYWAPEINIIVAGPYITKTKNETLIPAYEGAIPAWSLSALLDILPNNEYIGTSISRGGLQVEPITYFPNTWWCEYENTESLTEFDISADNPVDACYEMILKLNELNLL